MSYAQVVCLTPVDRVLLERCLQNDTAAFDEVVQLYKAKVYNYICRMTGDGDEAEDLTQEVFIRLYTSLKTFRSQSSLNTWIFRIASNLCIDRFRRRRKHQAIAYSLDEPLDSEEATASREVSDRRFEPHRQAEAMELSRQIDGALARLPEKLRAVLILHDIEDLPYEEVAQVVGCPIGTVKSRLFHARVKMRDYLSDYMRRD
jgi:RNA polymerase sigma-70 factor (ECF subfamily)